MKKFFSILLSLCMLLAFLPTVSLASGTDTGKALQLVTGGTAANIAGAQGSNVYYGTYFQSQIGGSEYYNPDPIKWRVLQNADGKLFLLSDKNLDAVPYHEDYVSITWEDSTICGWLNINFSCEAFSGAEWAAIPYVTVVNDDNPSYGTEGGNDTNDKVFLLSIAEVMTEAYGFPNNYDDTAIRQATNTDYAKNRGVHTYSNGCGDWWLRSPGINDNNVAFVSDDGYVDYDGYNVDYDVVAVRPAFHIDLNSVLFTSRAEGGKSSGATGADALTAIPDYDGSDWKLTVKDSTRSDFTAYGDSRDGDVLTVKYSGAKSGYHEYISAIIVNSSGVATHYGRLAAAQSGDNNTVTVNLAGKMNAGDKLYIFNEQANGDYMTDYASALIEVAADDAGASSDKATVKLYDIFGVLQDTKEFNVGDTFTTYTTLNTAYFDYGKIHGVNGKQEYSSSVLECLSDVLNDLDGVFPVTGDETNVYVDTDAIIFDAFQLIADICFRFNSDESYLIVTQYKVKAAGEASVKTSLESLYFLDSDRARSYIINNGTVKDDDFSSTSFFVVPETPDPDDTTLDTTGLTRLTGFTATGGVAGYQNENYTNLVDGDLATKWCNGSDGWDEGINWIDFTAPFAVVPKGYSLSTGGDTATNTGRNPKCWKLLARESEEDDWTTLAEVTDGGMGTENNTFYDFSLTEKIDKAYKYYRLEVTALSDGKTFQLGELGIWYDEKALVGEGTKDSPYIIASVRDWNAFAAFAAENNTSGVYVKQTEDITTAVTKGIPSFAGTYDGGGHTLTVDITGEGAVAPFRVIDGAKIEQLAVTGKVSGGIHCAGLVGGVAGGFNEIEDCLVDVAVASSGSHCAGFVGHAGAGGYTVSLSGCLFNGTLSAEQNTNNTCASFIGWSDSLIAIITDCLDLSSGSDPLNLGSAGTVVTNNLYYTHDKVAGNWRAWGADDRGTRAYTVTPGENVTMAVALQGGTYKTTGIVLYSNGMMRDGVLYLGKDVETYLSLSYTGSGTLSGFSASAGTLEKDGEHYVLKMPNENVTISAETSTEVSTWTDLKVALQAGGTIVLTADVKPVDAYWDDALTVPSGVTATLDLNGHIVDRGYRDDSAHLWDGSVIKISGTLTLIDSDPTAAHDPEFTYTDPITGRAMTVNGGILTGGHPDQYGGGVQVLGGRFDMKGGSIACNSVGKNAFGAVEALSGGGVYIQSGTFNMSGGAIVGNKAVNKNTMMPDEPLGNGGAVFIAGGTFTFSGGLIRGNSAGDYGGAIFVAMNGTFAMTGGIIVGNISKYYNNQVSNIDGGSAPNMVTSFLHSNDGNDYTSEQVFPIGADTTIATDVFVRDGYEFKGWAISADSNVALADGAHFSASGDGLLWAKWEKNVTTYPLWVGGVQVTSENKDNITAAIVAAGGSASGKAKFDPENYVLTLEGFTCSCGGAWDGYVTYSALLYKGDHDLKIVLIGENSLTQTGVEKDNCSAGINLLPSEGGKTATFFSDCGGKLTVTGGAVADGSSNTGGISRGIISDHMNIVISGADVTAEGGKARRYSNGVDCNWADLTVESGSLTAKGGEATMFDSLGINFNARNFTVNGGTLTAVGGQGKRNSLGFYGRGSNTTFTINGGTFTAQGKTQALKDATLTLADGVVAKASTSFDGTNAVTYDESDLDDYKWVKAEELYHPLDVNADGTVDMADALAISYWLASHPAPTKIGKPDSLGRLVGDANGDGAVDVKDVDVIMEYVVGLQDQLLGETPPMTAGNRHVEENPDFSFYFTDAEGNTELHGEAGKQITVYLKVKAETGQKIYALALQLKCSMGLVIKAISENEDLYGSFVGNPNTLRLCYQRPTIGLPANNGATLAILTVELPEGASTGTTYTLGLDEDCLTYKYGYPHDYYTTAFTPVTITVEEPPTYSVAVTPGKNMTKTEASGAALQSVAKGQAMTALIYTANDGYYFPEDYSVDAVNGITVTRDSFTQITVSGTPTADAAITLTAPTANNKEQTPTATFTATGVDTGTLSNVTAGMKYKIGEGEWQPVITGTSVDLAGLSPCTITVYMPGNGTTTIDSDEQTITVTKAETPNLAVTQPTTIGGNGVVETTEVHEWSPDTYDWYVWENCSVSQEWPQNCTIFIRVKAVGAVLASEVQEITINAFVPEKEQTPAAIFTATGADTGTLSNVAAGMKYKIDNGEWQTISGTSVDLTNLSPCTITLYTPGNGTTTVDSDEQTITVTKAVTPTLMPKQPTTIDGKGSIPTTTEHQKSTNGMTWTDCTGKWTGLKADKTYYVRVKAAGTVLASDAQAITINAYVPGQEQQPQAIFNATGADTGTLSGLTAGMNYKIDDGQWQTVEGESVDLTGLKPCTITLYTPGNGTTTIDSDEQTITVTKAETPALAATQPATINDKGVIPTTTAHEKSVNGTDWEECDGMWTDLDEGTYYVRMKAAGTALASDAQEIVIAVARYTVKFVDEDGTELQSTVYACGETPVNNGEEPTKEATAENTYTFSGWTPEITAVNGEATYTATYDATVNEYTVTFETNGGSDVLSVKVKYGEPVAEPDAPEKKSFAFAGWFADEGLETPYDFTAKITSDTKIYAKWTPISYPVFSGENPEWTKGSKEDVTITVKRSDADDTCLDHFTGVDIDGQPLENCTDFTAVKGSTVITLKAEMLEELSLGEHTVTINFDDGKVETKITVKAAPDPEIPLTGDNSHIGLWIALMIITFCGMAATLVIGKKKRALGK